MLGLELVGPNDYPVTDGYLDTYCAGPYRGSWYSTESGARTGGGSTGGIQRPADASGAPRCLQRAPVRY